MKKRIALVLTAISIFLGGCVTAPQTPIQLSQDSLTSKSGRVGVAMTALPKVDTYLDGANCLLCMAPAAAANSSLTTHAQTLPYEDLPKLKNDVATLLRKKGADAIVIADPINVQALPGNGAEGPNVAKKDFASLKAKYMVDKLLLIDISRLGFLRTYSSYIPTSDPTAVLRGTGYIVNLSNNTYEWYMPVNIAKGSDKNWDEPPQFPGLTNAYYQVLELGKDAYLKPFVN